jgi:hypothetical protein
MKFNAMLVVKAIILVLIVVSAFIDVSKATWLNTTPVKIGILVAVLLVSFFDLQLAILCTIAFLVLLINLNKKAIIKVFQERKIVKEEMFRGESLFPPASDKFVPVPPVTEHYLAPEPSKKQDEQMKNSVNQTIANFPAPYCPGPQYDNTYISETVFSHNVDERTKPYEEYVRLLAPGSSLEQIQTNHI